MTAFLFARLGLYLYTSFTSTPCQTGKTTFDLSSISRVNTDSNSVLVHPVFDRKFGVTTNMHLRHSLIPFPILSLRLSPTFNEYSSNHTMHPGYLLNLPAKGHAIKSLSRESCEMNAAGFSRTETSLAHSGPKYSILRPRSVPIFSSVASSSAEREFSE